MNKTKYVLGIDAGGTFFKSVLVAEDNSVVLDSAKKEPAGDDKTSVIDCYCRLIESAQTLFIPFLLPLRGKTKRLAFRRALCLFLNFL